MRYKIITFETATKDKMASPKHVLYYCISKFNYIPFVVVLEDIVERHWYAPQESHYHYPLQHHCKLPAKKVEMP